MRGLKLLLESLGIKIDPAEVEKAFGEAKKAVPQIVAAFNEINERLKTIEHQNKQILELVKIVESES